MALRFNGSTQYLTCANSSSLNPTAGLTLCGWIKRENLAKYDLILHKPYTSHSGVYYQYSLIVYPNQLFFWIVVGGVLKYLQVSSPTLVGVWYFVAGTFDGTTMSVFLDCVSKGSQVNAGTLTTYATSLFMGGNSAAGAWSQSHHFDNRIYNRALSLPELFSVMYSRGSDSIMNGLQGRWLLADKPNGTNSDNSASEIRDISGNGNHGTCFNTPVFYDAPLKLHSRKR